LRQLLSAYTLQYKVHYRAGYYAFDAWREIMIKTIAILLVALIMAAGGIFLASYAEADDAPGGVLIGIVVVVGAGALGVPGVQRIDSRRRNS
jgi:hypothetical protein